MAAFAQVTSPAGADDLLIIPIRQVTGGSEGAVLSVGSIAVPPDLVGRTCQIIGRTKNQVSVHPGNDLLIVTAGQTFIVPDFEDEGFVVHEAGQVGSLGATIDLQIRFGSEGRSSGGFSVSVDCEPDVTTTVAPESTTTDPVTTEPPTTAPVTTTTPATAPPSTAPPATGPTTPGPTVPAPTTASTDFEANPPAGPTETTPTSSTDTPESTTAPTSAPPPAGPTQSEDETLPVTGSQTGLLLGIGATMIAFGFLTRRLATAQRS